MPYYKDIQPVYSMIGQIGYNNLEDLNAISNSLRNLFMIRQGEVPGKPWLGNNINSFLFENIGFFEEKSIKTSFANTVQSFEPRVLIKDLKVSSIPEKNETSVYLEYYVLIEDEQVFQTTSFSLNYNEMTNLTMRRLQGATSGS